MPESPTERSSQFEGRGPHARVTPRLSIVIPVHDRRDLTRCCLESLNAMDTPVPFEVIIVDNGCSDGTVEEVSLLSERLGYPVQILSAGENLGFARGNNRGARAARAETLLFLNNDTEARGDFLSRPLQLLANPPVGVVGIQLRFPDDLVQHAGLAFDEHRSPTHVFRFYSSNHPLVRRSRPMQAVTGACLFIARELFWQCGGFDEGYENGWEDIDLCFRVRQHGRQVFYCGEVWAVHLESQTPGRLDHAQANEERFRRRWERVVIPDEASLYAQVHDLAAVVSRRPRRDLRRRLRFAINIGVPDRTHENWGDIFYARSLAAALKAAGHTAVVQYLDEWDRENRHVDVVVHLKGLSPYDPRPHHVNVAWIINHPERHTLEELNRYDLVLVASRPYYDQVREALTAPCHYLPQAGDAEHFRPEPDSEPDIDLLFVGNNYDKPRTGRSREAVEAAIAAGLGDRLRVVGEHWEGVLPADQVLATFVPWEDLPALYRRARVVLNDHQDTMRTGGFVNNRTYDLAFAGVCQVSNPVEGLEELGVAAYRDPRHLAELVNHYLADPAARKENARLVAERCAERTFPRAAARLVQAVRDWAEAAQPVDACDICGYSGTGFLDMGSRRRVRCPRCNSLERHRALWFLLLRDGHLQPGLDVLEISPLDGRLYRHYLSAQGCRYVCCDKWRRGNPLDPRDTSFIDVQSDVSMLAFADASFDLVLMQHVIEEVPDDRSAFAEIARVLKPHGVAILEIPQHRHVAKTDEFGAPRQFGNLRAYGVDVYERLGRHFKDCREEIVDGISFSVLRKTQPPTDLCQGFPILLDHPAADPTHAADRIDHAVAALTGAGYTPLTAPQAVALVEGKVGYRRPAWLTLDDGQAADVTQVLPWLRQRRIPATSFVIPGRMHEADWERVRAAAREPWLQVGSHSWQHDLRFCSDRLVDVYDGQPAYRNLFLQPVPVGFPVFEHAPALAGPAFEPMPEVVDFCLSFRKEHQEVPPAEYLDLLRAGLAQEFGGRLGTMETRWAFLRRLCGDVAAARGAIRKQLGVPPAAFAFPWGRQCGESCAVVARHHATAAGVLPSEVNHPEDFPYRLQRIAIGSGAHRQLKRALARTQAWERLEYRSEPAVTVLMPTRDRPRTVVAAIQSVVDQTFRDWHLVVVNDGGEDIADIIAAFDDPRISYYSRPHAGKAAALNFAIAESSSKYLAYLDDDDRFYPNHLDALVGYLESHPGCRFAYSMAREVTATSREGQAGRRERRVRYAVQADMAGLLHNNCIPNLCAVHERALLATAGTYDEDLDVLIDWDMYRRLAIESRPRLLNVITAEYAKGLPGQLADPGSHITSLYIRDIVGYYRNRLRITSKLECLRALVPRHDDCVWLMVTSGGEEDAMRFLAGIAWAVRHHPMDVGLLINGRLTRELVSFVQYAERLGALPVWNHEDRPEALFAERVMQASPWRRSLIAGGVERVKSHGKGTLVCLSSLEEMMSFLEIRPDDRPWDVLARTSSEVTGQRVLVVHSAPAAHVAQVIDRLRAESGCVRIDLFGRSHPLLDQIVDCRLAYDDPGAYQVERVSSTVLDRLRATPYDTVIVPLNNRDGAGYENVFEILARCGITECTTVNPVFDTERRLLSAPAAWTRR